MTYGDLLVEEGEDEDERDYYEAAKIMCKIELVGHDILDWEYELCVMRVRNAPLNKQPSARPGDRSWRYANHTRLTDIHSWNLTCPIQSSGEWTGC